MKLRLSDFDGVAFDFDGTLADSYGLHNQTRLETFQKHGFGDVSAEEHAKGHHYGNTTATIIAGTLMATGKVTVDIDHTTHPLVQQMVAYKEAIYKQAAADGIDAQPGAVELVRSLAQHFGVHKLTIVTTAQLHEVVPYLRRYDLEGLFAPELLITDETLVAGKFQPKPAPDAYHVALERLHITDPKRLLVIEDSIGGVISAKRAGTSVLALGTSVDRAGFYAKTASEHPDFFVPDFASLTTIG